MTEGRRQRRREEAAEAVAEGRRQRRGRGVERPRSSCRLPTRRVREEPRGGAPERGTDRDGGARRREGGEGAAAVAGAELASFVSCNPGVRSSKCSLSSYSRPLCGCSLIGCLSPGTCAFISSCDYSGRKRHVWKRLWSVFSVQTADPTAA